MTLDEIKTQAVEKIETDNPDATDVKVYKTYEHVMDGTLVSVSYKHGGKEDYNHVHFGRDGTKVYRYNTDVFNAVANYTERSWFFRFLQLAGIGGVIAFILVVAFSGLLFVLAFVPTTNPSVVEVVKLSFSVILGYFFGQTTAKK